VSAFVSCSVSSGSVGSTEEVRETFRLMLPRTIDWEELLEERRREVDRVDGRRDGIVGVSVVASLGIRR